MVTSWLPSQSPTVALAASGVLISAYAAGTVSEGITSSLRASHAACAGMRHCTRSLDLTSDAASCALLEETRPVVFTVSLSTILPSTTTRPVRFSP